MTPAAFRKAALSFPEVEESAHHGHPDFRVGGRIFATLGYPDATIAVVLLSPEEQAMLTAGEPQTFEPVPGGWGRKGSTRVRLPRAAREAVVAALRLAWLRKAPKKIAAKYQAGA